MYASRTRPLKVLVIMGSTRSMRNCDRLAKFIGAKLTEAGHEVKFADPLELKLPMLENPPHYYKDPTTLPENVQKINNLAKEADCYVVLGPEYNKHAPAVIFNMLDFVSQRCCGFKASAVVTYTDGPVPGPTAHAQLRTLMVEFGAPPIPFMFAIPFIQKALDPNGEVLEERINKQFRDMRTQLEWFATATRNHRDAVGEPKWGHWMSGPSDKAIDPSALL